MIDAIKKELEPIQKTIKDYEEDMGMVKRLVVEGSEQARSEASKTLVELRQVMGLDY